MREALGGVLMSLMLIPHPAFSQDLADEVLSNHFLTSETRVRIRVATQFPLPLLTRFRNIRRITTEVAQEEEFCGQVNAIDETGASTGYRLFLYMRNGDDERVQLLGSEVLNGFRVGRKMIGALKRAGCL
ncbi:hypothetical protein FV242_27380 [Methylobacterium sp. WL64]|uniref:hypothetical protein n=1 Tax=Methylobacterium sp. WL64 TaxID=2603894 RepID=UPI0011CA6F0C|nr:hypothetical protein [Methylobacterium sp. WL64]TXM98882.1 hypothetical protein FV242_27380 [Methylobacterium sp. WL64]